jgi:hypothetical protein
MQNLSPISLIYGVDFSGSQDACKKIWICKSIPTDEGLKVQECWNIKKKYGNVSLNSFLEKLTEFIASSPGAIFGLDFPFGLPKIIVGKTNWIAFIKYFPENYNDPDDFRQKCHDRALKLTGKKELKRDTDIETDSPFPPCNLRLFKQTYYGINNALRPLVMSELAKILPMEDQENSSPWVLEICPASTLKTEELYLKGYKKSGKEAERTRETILDTLIEKRFIREVSQNARTAALKSADGDALDSIIAAVATHRALKNNFRVPGNKLYKLEGYIYV